MTNLSLNKYKYYIYNAIIIIVNRYIKIIIYISIIKKINAIKLKKLLIRDIFLKFDALENIIINYKFIFINAF